MGIGDDAAVVKTDPDFLTLAATDMLVEDVHFTLATATAADIGYKALAVNISDIAAMGGIPEHALVSLALRPRQTVNYVEKLYAGLRECSRLFEVNIIGGDTVSSPKAMIINIAIIGRVEKGLCLYRSTAQPGDVMLVTGSLGAAAAGLKVLTSSSKFSPGLISQAQKYHFRPMPRVAEVRAALSVEGGISAADDISDGLASEIFAICKASNVGAIVDPQAVPIAPFTQNVATAYGTNPLDYAFYGGEDYELLLTCRRDRVTAVQSAVAAVCDTPVTPIGTIVPREEGISVLIEDKKHPLNFGGYEHFGN